jgi:arabinofuranan 3-O-arabinosyltransferase
VLRIVLGARLGFDLTVVLDAGRNLLHGRPVYADPLFLYLPSSALLAAPLALIPPAVAVAAGSVLAGLALAWLCLGSVRLLAPKAPAWAGPVVLLVVLLSQAGGALMSAVNVEVVAFAALPLLHRWSADGRWVRAGALLGLTLAVKPILAPLLLLPLLARRWRSLLLAAGVPVVLSAVAVALMPARGDVPHQVLTHLTGAAQPAFAGADVSLDGLFRSFGAGGTPVLVARAVVFVLGVGAAVLRWRQGGDDVLRVVESGTLALLATADASSLAWDHYVFLTVPLLVLAGTPGSLVRRAWLVWPCLLPFVSLFFPLPQAPVARFDYGARSGLGLLAVVLVLSAAVLSVPVRSALRSAVEHPGPRRHPRGAPAGGPTRMGA